MVASQFHSTTVSCLTECLKTTPMLAGLLGNAHHSAHSVRHVSSSADSAVELKVAPHQIDIVIVQVWSKTRYLRKRKVRMRGNYVHECMSSNYMAKLHE